MTSRRAQLREEVIAFHLRFPLVWDLFVQFTFDRMHRGFQHYSVNAIFERIRWETDQAENVPGKFKLNNNYRAFYARRFMTLYPQHAGFFRTRTQTSEGQPATRLPPLGPADFGDVRDRTGAGAPRGRRHPASRW